MPCDTIQVSKISFKMSVTDINCLLSAMMSLGFSLVADKNATVLTFRKAGCEVKYTPAKGEFNCTSLGYEFNVNDVKQQYSKQVLTKSCKSWGWTLTEEEEEGQKVRR